MMSPDKLDVVLAKLEGMEATLHALTERQRAQQELIDELMPIAKLMMATGTEKLGALEAKGYFAFGKAALGIVDRVVTGFSAEDVEQLGDNVVQILGTVKRFTQPAMLAVADEATQAIEDSKSADPLSWRGMLQASRDEDVQRGVAAAVAVLRRIGQLAHETSAERHGSKAKLAKLLGPSRAAPARPPPLRIAAHIAPKAPAPSRPAASCAVAPRGPTIEIPGVALGPDGFYADAASWTREGALAMAKAIGVELGLDHWKVIEFARTEFAETHKSPNVRRLSTGAGLSVKELYALFPGTPGKSAARVAGLPKPVGCI